MAAGESVEIGTASEIVDVAPTAERNIGDTVAQRCLVVVVIVAEPDHTNSTLVEEHCDDCCTLSAAVSKHPCWVLVFAAQLEDLQWATYFVRKPQAWRQQAEEPMQQPCLA